MDGYVRFTLSPGFAYCLYSMLNVLQLTRKFVSNYHRCILPIELNSMLVLCCVTRFGLFCSCGRLFAFCHFFFLFLYLCMCYNFLRNIWDTKMSVFLHDLYVLQNQVNSDFSLNLHMVHPIQCKSRGIDFTYGSSNTMSIEGHWFRRTLPIRHLITRYKGSIDIVELERDRAPQQAHSLLVQQLAISGVPMENDVCYDESDAVGTKHLFFHVNTTIEQPSLLFIQFQQTRQNPQPYIYSFGQVN